MALRHKQKKTAGVRSSAQASALNLLVDVLPHGVYKNEKNELFAVFKMIIGFDETSAQITINEAEWKNFVKSVDDIQWTWSFNNKILTIEKKGSTSTNAINFCFGKTIASTDKPWSFHLGKDNKAENDIFLKKIIQSGKTFIIPKTKSVKEKRKRDQMGTFADLNALEEYQMIKMDHTDKLKAASAYTKEQLAQKSDTVSDSNILNFKAVYSSLLEEPYMAQFEYGLVREFRISMSTFFKTADDDFPYAINVKHTRKSVDDTLQADFRMIKKGKKYYNGLNQLFISAKHFNNQVKYDFSDPYKNYLNKEKEQTHPDGIYVLVDTKGVADPFDKTYLKGFNVVVKHPRQLNYNSLSRHIKRYKLKNNTILSDIDTSGVMIGNCTLDTNEIEYTNNVLFAWRGDNLIVNCESEHQDDSNDHVKEGKSDYLEESKFIYGLFESKLLLKDSTQEQLWIKPGDEKNWNFNFYMRTVSPLEGYIKTEEELSQIEKEWDCILTMENIPDMLESILKQAVTLDTNFYDRILTKAPMIAGPIDYKRGGSEYVDQEQHMVLSRKELSEKRYIYPPSIKFEDFRYFGWLTPDKIEGGGKPINADEYAARCISLETRAASKFTAQASSVETINHLADERVPNLLFFPSDLSTINKLQVAEATKSFTFADSYPYFRETQSKELSLTRTDSSSYPDIRLDSSILYSNVADGIYNFRIYSTGKTSLSGLDKIKARNYTDMRMSIVNDPKPPLYNGIDELVDKKIDTERNEIANTSSWFFRFSTGKDQDTWKSLKLVEKTEMLRLMNIREDLDERPLGTLLEKYKKAHPDVQFNLLNQEYPYEIFLDWDDTDLRNNPLSPIIYPASLRLKILVSDTLRDNEYTNTFFTLPISDDYILKAVFDKTKRLKFTLNGDDIFMNQTFNVETEIIIEFIGREAGKPVFGFQLRCGTETKSLGVIINPTISIMDIAIDERLLQFLNLGKCKLDLKRNADYVIIGKEKDPYFKKKKIRLFASSIFQAYYPKSKSEWDMGTPGTLFKDIELPNNTLPEKCELDTDIYVMQKVAGGVNPVTEITKDNLVMITLPVNFMKEGPNRLGLIISEVIKKDGIYIEKTDDTLTSEMGEDVTKLTQNGTISTNLLDILNFDKLDQPNPLNKYYDRKSVKYYLLGGKIYKVLECKPHYNALSQKWQVMLSFDPLLFGKMESIFIKLTSFKIAPGQKCQGDGSSYVEAFVDKTKTCFSELSKPIHLPIYNRKRFTFENKFAGTRRSVEIKNTNVSDYKNKAFFVMVFKNEISSVNELGRLNIGKFDLLDASGKVIDSGDKLHFIEDQIIISPTEGQGSVVVLEFEKHKNFNDKFLDPATHFVEFNPLFDTYKKKDDDSSPNARGLRLINIIEYK